MDLGFGVFSPPLFRGSLKVFILFSRFSLPLQHITQKLLAIFDKESKLNFVLIASK